MKRWKLFLPLVIFIAMATLLYKGLSLDPNKLPSMVLDRPIPEFELPNLDERSQMITHSDLATGKPYLLNVWATWCPTCRYEHPYLLKLAKLGIPIVGIDWKDEAGEAIALLKKTGNPYTKNIFDVGGVLPVALGVTGAPETFVVDSKGVIRYHRVGAINADIWTSKMAPVFNGSQ